MEGDDLLQILQGLLGPQGTHVIWDRGNSAHALKHPRSKLMLRNLTIGEQLKGSHPKQRGKLKANINLLQN